MDIIYVGSTNHCWRSLLNLILSLRLIPTQGGPLSVTTGTKSVYSTPRKESVGWFGLSVTNLRFYLDSPNSAPPQYVSQHVVFHPKMFKGKPKGTPQSLVGAPMIWIPPLLNWG